jgi:hypothetical protein
MGGKRALPLIEQIERSIYLIRGHKVMLDHELADLYGVSTKALKQAVRRNLDRFPSDFMFELTKKEFANLRSQIVTSSSPQWGGLRYSPMAFTEQGIAMLSSVLRSKRAVQVNIAIMRVFVRLREITATHKELARKLEDLENRLGEHDEQFKVVFDAIRTLMLPPERPKKKIGFEVREPKVRYGKKGKKSQKET